MESKSAFKSKLNLLGLLLVAGPLIDPVRDTAMAAVRVLPEEYRPLATSLIGLAVIVLRTFFTKQPVTIRPE